MNRVIGRPQLPTATHSCSQLPSADIPKIKHFCALGSILAFSVPCFLPQKAALQPTLNRSQLGSNFTKRNFLWNAVDLKQFPRTARPRKGLKSIFETFRRGFAPDPKIPSSQRESHQSPPYSWPHPKKLKMAATFSNQFFRDRRFF